MASNLVLSLTILSAVVPSIIMIYGAYWAFQIRRALSIGIYRSQALWLGFFLLWFIGDLYFIGFDTPALMGVNVYYDVGVTGFYFVLGLVLFRLVDVDVGVARRSDPLLRETLRWRRLRLVVWGIMGAGVVLVLSLVVLRDNGLVVVTDQTLAAGEFDVLRAITFLTLLVVGLPVLLIAASRSRDLTLRRTLKWLGASSAVLTVSFMVYFAVFAGLFPVSRDLFNATAGLAFVPGAYCFYRSAKSLAPLDHLTPSAP